MEALVDAGQDSKCDVVHQLLCMACLGPGLTLHVLKDKALELYNITVNSGKQLANNVSPRVCWECELLLKNVIHFREGVKECHDILNSSHVLWSEVTRLSRLQMYTTAQIDIPPLDSEYSIPEVKQEIEEVEHHEPSETEETQPCMGCLCGGRRLNNIRDKELKYYTDILNQRLQVVHYESSESPRLCWECCCILRRATRFSEQSRESYRTLLPSLLTADIQDITSLLCSGVSLPPRLRRCVRDRVDIPPHAYTHNPLPPVKLEPGSLGFGDSSTPPAGYVQHPDEPAAAAASAAAAAAEVKQTSSQTNTAHATTSNITCDRCHREFTSKQQLIRHIAGNIYPHNTNVCDDNSYVWVESALKDPRRRRHSAQVTSHAGDKPYQCNNCTKTFALKQYLVQHLRTHSGVRPHQCSQCSKTFTRKQHLVDHMRTHTAEKPYQCKKCSKAYARKQYLVEHMRTHTKEELYQCSQCSKTYTRKQGLFRHIRTHTGERPYQCSQCSKAYIQKQHLVDHMRTHTAEKPYQCKKCSKLYARKQYLIEHMRTHTKEELHKCSQCSKMYTRKQDLFRHTRTHSGERPYQCSQCSKAYIQKHHLVDHMRSHTKEKPYQCTMCSKMYTRKQYLAEHIKIQHTGEKSYECNVLV